jgi:hypothetical protein
MKKSKIAPLKLKLRVNAEIVLHLRPVHDGELQRLRGGLAKMPRMTTYHPDCYTGEGCRGTRIE